MKKTTDDFLWIDPYEFFWYRDPKGVVWLIHYYFNEDGIGNPWDGKPLPEEIKRPPEEPIDVWIDPADWWKF